jgi:4-amino-4-deoxy-L-arabinose transferase-like glycosyltransferase
MGSILLAAAWLRVWNLARNGFGNAYYAAAVRSMLQSWHNFFFVAFDPAGWVTVDKPPLALWIQAASAKAFGYGALSLLLPQAAEGVAGVALLMALVRRHFGRASALMAGLMLAISPLSVAVDRYNNTDACLVFVSLLAAWAVSLAAEHGGRIRLLAAMALVGLAFNTKMGMGLGVAPGFLALYLFAAPDGRGARIRNLLLACLVLALVSLSWVLCVDFTPPEQRPFVGSTQGNSMLELSLGWNGMQRLFRTGRGRGAQGEGGEQAAALSRTASAPTSGGSLGRDAVREGAALQPEPAWGGGRGPGQGRRRGGRGGMGAGEPGGTRLADSELAGQVLWFLPLALFGFFAAWKGALPKEGNPAAAGLAWPARVRSALLGNAPRQGLFLWAGWFLPWALVFSYMRGAIHVYYLVLLAPPMAALSAVGLRSLWLEYLGGRRAPLAVALLLCAQWQAAVLLQYPDWSGALLPILAGGSALAAWGLAVFPVEGRRPGGAFSWARVCMAVACLSLLVCPLGWAMTPVFSPTGDRAVQADPSLITGAATADGAPRMGRGLPENPGATRRLLAFLDAHRGGTKYLVAAPNSMAVSSLIIASGEPAIAIGGFMGGDPILSAEAFEQKVRDGEIRYFLLNEARPGQNPGPGAAEAAQYGGPWGGFGPGGNNPQAAEIARWVRTHGHPVDASLWKVPEAKPLYGTEIPANPFFGRGRGGALQLYDLGGPPAGFRPVPVHKAWGRRAWNTGGFRPS